jgi:hypothetical protein
MAEPYADLLGGGGWVDPGAGGPRAPAQRATDATGLFYLDTGEPTPLYYARQTLLQGGTGRPELDRILKETDQAVTYRPSQQQIDEEGYKFDSERGLWYRPGKGDQRIYISNDPARAQSVSEAPMFTVEDAPRGQSGSPQDALLNGLAMGAAGGAAGGIPGAAGGAVLGAISGLPQAQGRGIRLAAGTPDPRFPNQRIGTQAEADRGNAYYAATGSSLPPGGGNDYFPEIPDQFQGGPMATYTPTMGTNGGSALSNEARRVLDQASQFATQNQAAATNYGAQAATAGTRAAPQMATPSSSDMQDVYNRAMSFNAQSGADAIRAERADISGAGRLESMQMDMQGISNLEGFQSTNSAQGVAALRAYRPDATYASADQLENWQANNTARGADAVRQFDPANVQQDAQALRDFRADRTGIDRLNAYADAPEGPSQAQALLRLQSDADKRTMLALARSGRGGPGAAVNAQRQAITEGGLISAETRGQASALRAQETDMYKQRQLQALAQAGSLISQAEAQRLTALSNAGALMSAADQQKLQSLIAYGELKATQDAQQLSARQSAGQLNLGADTNMLGATQSAAALQGQMDAQRLSALGTAAGLRTQADQIRSSNLQSAGQIRLSGSEINQRGAIAASQADLQAQALNLQSLSLAGNISSTIRAQDIDVLRTNLGAELQTLALNDQQVRFFSQLESDRTVASQNLQMQANALGINAQQAQQALDLQWAQFGYSQLSDQQQLQYQYAVLGQGQTQFAQQLALNQQQQAYAQRTQDRNFMLNAFGSGLTAFSQLFPTSQQNTTARRS